MQTPDVIRLKHLEDIEGMIPDLVANVQDDAVEATSIAWHEALVRLKNEIHRTWRGTEPDRQVFVDSEWSGDRMFAIEICDREILSDVFVKTAYEIVDKVDAPFCFEFCNSWVLLENEDGTPFPDFNLFVTEQFIALYTESESLAELLCGAG